MRGRSKRDWTHLSPEGMLVILSISSKFTVHISDLLAFWNNTTSHRFYMIFIKWKTCDRLCCYNRRWVKYNDNLIAVEGDIRLMLCTSRHETRDLIWCIYLYFIACYLVALNEFLLLLFPYVLPSTNGKITFVFNSLLPKTYPVDLPITSPFA